MLEKNKDYVEMRVSSTDCAFTQNEPTLICIDGYVYTSYIRLPDPGELYILISKEKFEKLLDKVVYYMALSTRHEANYNLLLEKTGFTSVADLVDYIHDPSMTSPEDKTLREIIDECEEDYISERDKAEELQTENEQLKKKLEEKTAEADDPLPDFRELLKKLYSTNDVENLEWTLNHVCGGRGSVNGWIAVSSFWKQKYETLSKLVGFVTVEETRDYLTNEAECDTLHEAILKLKDQVKYTCDEWYSANSRNNSWKAAAECNSPKELIEKRETLEGKVKALETEAEVYSRALKEWKEITGCPSPSAAKTLIESGMSYVSAYHEVQEENRKLIDDINSWKNVTGYSTPEDFLSAKINKVVKEVSSWEEITGFSTPEKCSSYIDTLEKKLEDIKDLIEED